MASAPCTTWLLVSTSPSCVNTNPEPLPPPDQAALCPGGAGIFGGVAPQGEGGGERRYSCKRKTRGGGGRGKGGAKCPAKSPIGVTGGGGRAPIVGPLLGGPRRFSELRR